MRECTLHSIQPCGRDEATVVSGLASGERTIVDVGARAWDGAAIKPTCWNDMEVDVRTRAGDRAGLWD